MTSPPFALHPKADERFTVCGAHWRITVLTDRLLRLEYSERGVFEDLAAALCELLTAEEEQEG